MFRLFIRIVGILFLLVLMAVPISFLTEPRPQQQASVQTPVDRKPPNDDIIARGRIEPFGRVIAVSGPPDAGSTVALVDKLLVEQGSKVLAGQVVAVLNGFDLSRTDYAVAEANLHLAELQYSQTQAGVGKAADIAAQINVITGRRAQLVRARKDWERAVALVQNQNASIQTLDLQKATLDQMASDVEQSQNALKALTEVRAVDDAVSAGQVVVAKATLAKAKAAMERLQIRAPVSGTVLSIQTRDGEAIGADGILRMGDLDHLIIVAEVDQGQVGRISEGMRAQVEGSLVPQLMNGKVTRIAQEVFRQKRPSSDILIGRDAKIVEVEVTTQSPLPPVVGGEVTVHLMLPALAANGR